MFKHNEHQVDQAKSISEKMKFFNFLPRKTGRFFHHGDERELDSWPVQDRRSRKIVYWLNPPTDSKWKNDSLQNLPSLKKQFKDLDDYFNTTAIKCDALIGKKVAISAEGLVMPCNFFTHNLYDARFREPTLPGANIRHMTPTGNQVRELLEKYGLDNFNIHHHSLEKVFSNQMWADLVDSWLNNNRLFECAMTCGEKFTKVWDQGGNKRC